MCELQSSGSVEEQQVESHVLVVWWQSVLGCEDLLLPGAMKPIMVSDMEGIPGEVWRCSPTNLHDCTTTDGCNTNHGFDTPYHVHNPGPLPIRGGSEADRGGRRGSTAGRPTRRRRSCLELCNANRARRCTHRATITHPSLHPSVHPSIEVAIVSTITYFGHI